jgi:hypothetical protein
MNDNVFGVTQDPAAESGVNPPLASGSETQDTEQPREPDDAPEPPPAEPAKPEREADEDDDEKELLSENPKEGFRIGDKVYKDVESADRAFKRNQGRARAEARRRQEVETSMGQELERTRGLLEKALSVHQQPQTQDDQGIPATPPPPPKPKRLTDLVSREEFDALVAEKGPAEAFARIAELTEQRLEEALEESQRETRPLVRQHQVADKTAQTFDGAALLKGADGQPLYPEIANPDSPEAVAVYELWQRNFADPQLAPLAFTPHAVRMAVMEYRAAANGQPASRGPRTPAGAAVGARREADRSLQSMGTDSRSSARPAAPGPVGGDEERIQAAMRAQRHPVFGVTVRAGN